VSDNVAGTVPVVVPPVDECRVTEQIRRRHPHTHARGLERLLEAIHDLTAFSRRHAPRDQVVVVQADAPRAELRQLVDGVHGIHRLTRRPAERIAAGVADGPEPEGEPVLGAVALHLGSLIQGGRHQDVSSVFACKAG
jgi:hypothetical protein